MAKVVPAFADNRGMVHTSAEQAVLSDIETVLGRIGADAGITSGLAQKILEKRTEIEAAFADYDALTASAAIAVSEPSERDVTAA